MAVSHRGAISFGLVHIPVSLYRATDENSVGFNLLHKDCKGRIRYKKTCPDCSIDDVKQSDIVKGFEYEDGKYVIMQEEDFEKIKTEKDRTIHILHFADLNEIDPIFYEKTYYAVPDSGGDKAFELLRAAMQTENKVAIARTVLGTKENLLTIRPVKDGIMVETMYFLEEVKAVPKAYTTPEVNEDELNMAKMLIGSMTQKFQPEDYRDEYILRVKEAIRQKINGQEIVEAVPARQDNIVNLMDALQQSLEQKQARHA